MNEFQQQRVEKPATLEIQEQMTVGHGQSTRAQEGMAFTMGHRTRR